MAQRIFTQTFGVVSALLERDGKVLLVREAKNQLDRGKWSHPAGWIDVGEDPIEAVRREVQEETGFDFAPTHVLGVYSLVRRYAKTMPGATRHAIKIVFLGRIPETASHALHDDVSEVRWFFPEEIYQMDAATLRDVDIKQMVRDYLAGKQFPLDVITHTVAVPKI